MDCNVSWQSRQSCLFQWRKRITYERWQTIPDYTILQACNHNILCVGGAISIDRQMRLQWMDIRPEREAYWIDEAPVYNPMALDSLSEQGVKIDTVVSHTAPSFLRVANQTWFVFVVFERFCTME